MAQTVPARQTVQNMTEGSPVSLILRFALPIFISQVFQQLYSTADARSSGKNIGMRYLSCRHGILQMPDNLLVPDNIVETNHSESPLLFLYTNLCSPCLHYSILCYPFKTIFVYEREFIYFIIFSTHNSKFSLANLNLIPAFRMFSSEKSS